MKKKISIILAAVMTLTLLCTPVHAYKNSFSDVPEDAWEAPYVYELAERGVISGYGDGTFGPRLKVQRCEYAKMLVGLTGTELVKSAASPYADVPVWEWYFPYVNSSLQFISGYSDNGTLFFRPEWDATREVVTTALVKAKGIDVSGYTDPTAYLSERLSDVDTIAVHNRAYVAAAMDKGYITGDEGGTFRGQDPIIRAEIAAVLCRAFPKEKLIADSDDKENTNAVNFNLTAFFLDVGQGDSGFLELPEGKTMLIDAGTSKSAKSIVSFIRSRGHSRIDYVIATHPHADHIGGMTEILNNFEIGDFYTVSAKSDSKTYKNMISALTEKEIPVTEVTANYRLLGIPQISAVFAAPVSVASDLNNASCVLRLSLGESDFLFAGDAESESEKLMLSGNVPLDAEVLKVGHHGSKTSSTEAFVWAVHPIYAIISCGVGNSYGHPSEETLDRLAKVGAKTLRTDINGTIEIRADKYKVTAVQSD